MGGPLNGIRVLDLTSVLMGPYCTLLLGDMGADVIKVESSTGDSTRYVGPSRSKGMGGVFMNVNRSKRSVVLDLKAEEGKKALLKLAQDCDVLIHTIRPQAMANLGLSYEEVSKVNSRIIYCGAYGFKKDGPYGAKPAYDDMIQGASGLAAAQGVMTGEPQYMATVVADKTTGLMALNAIMTALYSRERTGEGQHIEVPMFETMVSYNLIEHMYGFTFDPPLSSSFYPRATSPYRKPYKTLDGYVCVLIYTDKQWVKFFELSGQPELIHDEKFHDLTARTEHIDELYQMVENIMATKTTEEWLELLRIADIPSMPLNRPEDLVEDPHLKATGFFKKVTHPSEGNILDVSFPVTFSKTPAVAERLAPRLGEHSVEVLKEAGYTDAEIDKMIQSGITGPMHD